MQDHGAQAACAAKAACNAPAGCAGYMLGCMLCRAAHLVLGEGHEELANWVLEEEAKRSVQGAASKEAAHDTHKSDAWPCKADMPTRQALLRAELAWCETVCMMQARFTHLCTAFLWILLPEDRVHQ